MGDFRLRTTKTRPVERKCIRGFALLMQGSSAELMVSSHLESPPNSAEGETDRVSELARRPSEYLRAPILRLPFGDGVVGDDDGGDSSCLASNESAAAR